MKLSGILLLIIPAIIPITSIYLIIFIYFTIIDGDY